MRILKCYKLHVFFKIKPIYLNDLRFNEELTISIDWRHCIPKYMK